MRSAGRRPTLPPPGDVSPWRLWAALSAGQLIWGALLVGAWLALVWPARTDPDYTAGEILDSTMAWSESGRLYSPIDHTPYRVFNYPPAFPAAVRLLMAAGLAPLLAGRLLTLASIAIVVLLSYRWLRAVGCHRSGAVLALSLFASSFPLMFYVGQFHLQWAAVAASLFGCYLLRAPTSAARVALAGGSLALACFFKQTQIWSLVLMGAWLLVHHRDALRAFATAAAAVAALGVVAVFGIFGTEAWLHLVTYTVGTFSFKTLTHMLWLYVGPWTLPFVFGLWIAARDPVGRRDVRFWYFAGSSLGLLSAARSGAGPQYLIEWSIATVLWIGPSIQELLRTPRWRGWAVAVLAAHLVLGDAITAERLFVRGVRLRHTELALPELCAALPADAPTPIESAAVARACGRTPALHPFIMTNLAERGLWDERPFVQDIARGAFAVIVLPFELPDGHDRPSQRWTPAMLAAVRQRYRLAEEHDGWRVFRPLRSAGFQ
jgi:hypothetical protein